MFGNTVHLVRFVTLAVSFVIFSAACGGAQPSGGATQNGGGALSNAAAGVGSRTADEANVAVTASDPRNSDPTAARASASPVSTSLSTLPQGGSATTSGGPGGATAAAKQSDPSDGSAKPGGATGATKSEADLPKKISARHVLIQWMGTDKADPSIVRSKEQALAVAKQVLKRAKAGEDFARLAIEFSDEPGAGSRGGSLGRFGRGQMVPAFEQAAFRLEVNEVSDIVETPFGYHIIKRTE